MPRPRPEAAATRKRNLSIKVAALLGPVLLVLAGMCCRAPAATLGPTRARAASRGEGTPGRRCRRSPARAPRDCSMGCSGALPARARAEPTIAGQRFGRRCLWGRRPCGCRFGLGTEKDRDGPTRCVEPRGQIKRTASGTKRRGVVKRQVGLCRNISRAPPTVSTPSRRAMRSAPILDSIRAKSNLFVQTEPFPQFREQVVGEAPTTPVRRAGAASP